MTFREKYMSEMDSVTFSDGFEVRTANLMKMQRVENDRKDVTILPKRKPVKVFAVALAIIVLLSSVAFAVSYYLSAKQVAEYLGDKAIAEMFEDSESVPQTVSNGTYDVTFLGETTGTKLNMTEGFEAEETRTYAVVAIRKTDGTPLSLMDGMPVNFAPVIEGVMPFQSCAILNFSASGLERDGILYYLFDYENLEVFADRTVSIALLEGVMFPGPDVLTMDESGKIVYAESYMGIRGMFELPLDESKADPEAAAELLSTY